MLVKVLSIRPVARSSWLTMALRVGTECRTFAARVVHSRTEEGVLEGVVFSKDLLQLLQPNMLAAKSLTPAILNVHAGRPQAFPFSLNIVCPATPRRRPWPRPVPKRPVRMAS